MVGNAKYMNMTTMTLAKRGAEICTGFLLGPKV